MPHIDNLKLSHKDPNRVSAMIAKLESIYATADPTTVHRGKVVVYHYLGMILDFRVI